MNLKFYDINKNIHQPNSKEEVEFRPGVYAFVENNQGEILMIVDEKSNQWELPGGGLHLGEDLIDGTIREIKEETGYEAEIKSLDPFHIEKEMAYYDSSDKFVHGINFFYLAELESEKQQEQNFAEDENILEVEFFNSNKLTKLDIVHFQQDAVDKFLQKY
ncbi:MAG: NUDIX hydrolase [Candidatus Magasanikbacteria bacterium]